MGSSEDFPEELAEPVRALHSSLAELRGQLEAGQARPREELVEGMDPLDRAKVDLVSAYAINSLVWMLLKTQGSSPAEAGVKGELDRVKAAMVRCKELQDKARRGRVDQAAAQRLVTSGLWRPGEEKLGKRPVAGDGSEAGEGEQHTVTKRKKIGQFDV